MWVWGELDRFWFLEITLFEWFAGAIILNPLVESYGLIPATHWIEPQLCKPLQTKMLLICIVAWPLYEEIVFSYGWILIEGWKQCKVNVKTMSNPYRDYDGQYDYADRDFNNGDTVVFVGPPDDEFQLGMITDPSRHALHGCIGQIRIGKSESILVYPDEPDAGMYWVRFEDDTQSIRQIRGTWLVKEGEIE